MQSISAAPRTLNRKPFFIAHSSQHSRIPKKKLLQKNPRPDSFCIFQNRSWQKIDGVELGESICTLKSSSPTISTQTHVVFYILIWQQRQSREKSRWSGAQTTFSLSEIPPSFVIRLERWDTGNCFFNVIVLLLLLAHIFLSDFFPRLTR